MSHWTQGYVTELEYLAGYYQELNPLHHRLALLYAGYLPPETANVCELGFGLGLSINFHAAALAGISYWGTDFNPIQTKFALELAQASGAKVNLFDQSFAEFCERKDLPDFDGISLHGIWSWINADNRKIIVDFIRRKLKVGGVVYISYNSFPGFANFLPMRRLMVEHANRMSASASLMANRIDASIQFIDKLLELNPAYAQLNQNAIERFKKIKNQDRRYLAHEYFNSDWYPTSFLDISSDLSSAKLTYACSAHLLSNIQQINLTPAQQQFLAEISDVGIRETANDFLWNQQFRRDCWIKGPRKIDPDKQIKLLRKQRVVQTRPRSDVVLKVSGYLGEASMQRDIYDPILDMLASNGPVVLEEMEQSLAASSIGIKEIVQAIMILIGKGDAGLAQTDEEIAYAQATTDKLNKHLVAEAEFSKEVGFLVSPVTTTGIDVNRVEQLFILAQLNGISDTVGWANYAWNKLVQRGERITKEGQVIYSEADNQNELKRLALVFSQDKSPLLLKLKIV